MNTDRKLVTIRMIDDIQPIENADFIELAIIDGWQCVVKKGEFVIDSLCLYFEVDSFLPIEDERFEFLHKGKITWRNKEGIRLKTAVFKGQLSQGLALPIKIFSDLQFEITNQYIKRLIKTYLGHERALDISNELTEFSISKEVFKKYANSLDFASFLNIEKWERDIPSDRQFDFIQAFPNFIRGTSLQRIQNMPDIFEEYKDVLFEETNKMNGESMTVYYNNGHFGVCSPGWEFKYELHNPRWSIIKQSNYLEVLKKYNRNIAIQGEFVGTSIQRNHHEINKQEFHIFNIFDIDNYRDFSPEERYDILNELESIGLSFNHVKILSTHLRLGDFDMPTLLKRADEYYHSKEHHDVVEGIIWKSLDGKIKFKVISNKSLIELDT